MQDLSDATEKYGEENIIYFDESGFEEEVVRPHCWAPRGKKISGNVSGSKRHRTNLIMAQRCREWLSPMVFDFSCDSIVVNLWLEEMLLPKLTQPSVIVMDNASFHNPSLTHYFIIRLKPTNYGVDFFGVALQMCNFVFLCSDDHLFHPTWARIDAECLIDF